MQLPAEPRVVLESLGRTVRDRRRRSERTIAELAEASGLSPRFLGELERGRANISLSALSHVAGALGLSAAELLLEAESADPTLLEQSRALRRLPAPARERLVRALVHAAVPRSARRIALVGLRGAGKSTLGPLVAERLGVEFVELDREIERAAGLSLSDLFSLHGEAQYRELELAALRRFCRDSNDRVLATGGSIVLHAPTFELLQSHYRTVWLEATAEDHWNRVIAQGDHRPMEGDPEARERLRELLRERAPLYALCHDRLETSRSSVAECVEELVRRSRN